MRQKTNQKVSIALIPSLSLDRYERNTCTRVLLVVLEAFLILWLSATSLQLLASILRPPYPIHPSACKEDSPKSMCRILDKTI